MAFFRVLEIDFKTAENMHEIQGMLVQTWHRERLVYLEPLSHFQC